MEKIQLMIEKINILNNAAKAYYQEDREIMSNFEYDKIYDELAELEKETGITLSNSPTVRVGYELLSSLPKEQHERPMLSLDKTKEIETLKEWLGSEKGLLSWKLDGLTIVLTYREGKLYKAVTRGNGEVGEVVTNNVKVFKNIPLKISYQGDLILRGEAVISYSDFEKINDEILDVDFKFKNPRNLCSGAVRQLNNKVTAQRNVYFFAFALVKADGIDFGNSRENQLNWLKNQGFTVVESRLTDSSDIEASVKWFSEQINKYDFPSDGLVLTYNDIAYGESLGYTAKFPRDSIAFKWRDEIKETALLEIEWSASRTGLINPVAIFEPVELEGTTVSRASLHNISILEGLELGIGDTITVYKANMIIPQVADNLSRSGTVEIPDTCPSCAGKAVIKNNNDIRYLYCINEDCPAKRIKSFTLFVSRDAMNIEGLSEATIEKLLGKGFVKEFGDLYHLEKYKSDIIGMEGFGERSFQKLIASINKSRKTTTVRLLYSMGIPNIGLSTSKLICKHFLYNWEDIQNASRSQLIEINGIGEVMADAYVSFFSNEKNRNIINNILKEVEFEKISVTNSDDMILSNLVFVITGSVEHFKNRDELKRLIEEKGGKVTDTVTSKTNYLINNDSLSNSSKNKKAKELGIKIITEKEFLEML